MIHLFCGYDDREAIGHHVFVDSVLRHTRAPVAITALDSRGLPEGSNAFTFSRFLVPWLMGWQGVAIFVDGADMLLQADLQELRQLFDPQFAVQVVKHPTYATKHRIKYVGTDMECPNVDYPRKNWASVMLINCAARAWRSHTPEVLSACAKSPRWLLGLEWLAPELIGELPDEWNRLVDEGHPVEGAKILHWTAGIPYFPHYRNAPGAAAWHGALRRVMETA